MKIKVRRDVMPIAETEGPDMVLNAQREEEPEIIDDEEDTETLVESVKASTVAALAKVTSPKVDPVRRKRVEEFVKTINATMRKAKSQGRVDLGTSIQYLDPPRIRTGSLGLDIITNGGLPVGNPTQFWGVYASGKTTSAFKVAREVQSKGGAVAFAAAEGFQKPWARKNGLLIPYSAKEFDAMKKSGIGAGIIRQIERDQSSWPPFVLLQHAHGDGLLELTSNAVKANVYDLVVVDSLGVIKSYADLEERSLEDDKYGGEAKLFGSFSKKVNSALARRFDPETNQITTGDNWVPNRTAVLCINQARDNIGGYSPRPGVVPKKPTGGETLKHWWCLNIEFTKGPRLTDKKEKGSYTPNDIYGVTIQAYCEKTKVGPPFMEAEWDFYVKNHGGFRIGDIDLAKEVAMWGQHFNMIAKEGTYYEVAGERVHGKDALVDLLRSDMTATKKLAEDILETARRQV